MIDLCSTSSSDEDIMSISPIKPRIKYEISHSSSPEEVIKGEIPNVNDNDFHSKDLPILARPTLGLNVNQLFTLMIGTVPANRICHRKPTSVTYSAVFVVDLVDIRSIDDLRADDNGAWIHGGKPRRCYRVEVDNYNHFVNATLYDGTPSSSERDVFTLVRAYHRHKATPEFQRRIAHVIDSNGQTVQYAVVQYLFDNGIEVPVVMPPHGNSKRVSSSYRRTQISTLSSMKKIQGTPKVVISAVHNEAGGVLGAKSSIELPRNRRQVYNQRSAAWKKLDNKIAPIFELVQQCKVDLLPGGRKFIRCVSFDTSPSCVLATESQLNDMVRFCMNPVPRVFVT